MPRDRHYLLDISEAARLAISYINGKSKDDFYEDIQRQDSVIRRIAIIGEAARRISPQFRAKYPELPWGEMIGMRNILIHEYDDIDLDIVWVTVERELPLILDIVARLLIETEEKPND
jgi:uncharacterized protein with HEPN domain